MSYLVRFLILLLGSTLMSNPVSITHPFVSISGNGSVHLELLKYYIASIVLKARSIVGLMRPIRLPVADHSTHIK